MARLIPSQPTGSLPRPVVRLFQSLKKLPDEWTIWLQMSGGIEDSPDFLLRHSASKKVFLVCASRHLTHEACEASVLGDVRRYAKFSETVQCSGAIGKVLVHHDLESAPDAWITELESNDVEFVSGEVIRNGGLEERLLGMAKGSVVHADFLHVREHFNPESVLDASRACSAAAMFSSPKQTSLLLDVRQEELAKREVDLSDEAKRLVGDFSVRLLTGVAGSGKTLVLLHRAALLAKHLPNAKILVLTFNKPLSVELQRRIKRIDSSKRIEQDNFHHWCFRSWPTQGARSKLPLAEKKSRIDVVGEEVLGRGSPVISHLESELDWIQDSGFDTWEAYAEADRKGRGFRLNAQQREQVWEINTRWRVFLDGHRLGDYPHFGYRFCKALRDGLAPAVQYDHILVDEAQFFAPTWFEIVRRHLKPQGALFLCADPSQGFLRQGASWKSAGLEVRGRTDRLARSYRTTRQILTFAWSFLVGRNAQMEEDSVTPDFSRMVDGPEPRFFAAPDMEAQIRFVAAEILQQVQIGIVPSSFLVLLVDPGLTNRCKSVLEKSLPGKVYLAEDQVETDAVRVCSLGKATGLEASVVYVIGASGLLEAEANPGLTEDARTAKRQENARMLYTAFTRAAQVLVIGWCGAVPEELGSGGCGS